MVKLTQKDKLALSIFKNKLTKALNKDRPHLILFGSKARSDSRPDSDIDVLIIIKEISLQKRQIISDIATEIFLEKQVDISPHVYSQKEYQNFLSLQTPFMLLIKREGLAI